MTRQGGVSASAEVASEPAPTADTSGVDRRSVGRLTELGRWIAPVALALFVVVSLVRTGVPVLDIVRFSMYWTVALVAPGLVISRALLGAGRNVVEDLSIAAVTGLSLEVLSILLGLSLGVGTTARFWWLPVLIVGATLPAARAGVAKRVEERVRPLHSAALAGLCVVVLLRLDLTGFRSSPLPPASGSLNQDLWWHLSLVQEMMRFEPPQVPQVAGTSLTYHFFSHIHLAAGTKLSGVLPEIVLLRLWFVPLVLVTIGLAFTLGRAVTLSSAGGVAAAWLGFGLALQTYLWIGLPVFGAQPIVFTSPSQVLGNVGLLAAAIGFVPLLRNGVAKSHIAWLCVVVAGAGGSKSTIVPLLIAATSMALMWAIVSRSKRWPTLAAALVALFALQGFILVAASAKSGGKVILFGTLKSLSPYRDLVPDTTYRAVNDGLLLDSIASPRTALFAGLSVLVFLGGHAIRLVGLVTIAARSTRADLVNWWLSGAILAGFAASLVVDHVGLSQVWFVLSVVPFGATLTVHAFLQLTESWQRRPRAALVAAGLGVGSVVMLVVDYTVRARQRAGDFGALERVLVPLVVVGAFTLVVGLICWRLSGVRQIPVLGLLLVAVVGVAIPGQIVSNVRAAYRWVGPVAEPSVEEAGDYVTRGELEAMVWLREHSEESDVIVTNVHCRPVRRQFFPCDSRGFWVVGLSGRRAVIEGWAYTSEAQRLQGVDGRVWSLQPSLYPERERLNGEVFEGDESALRTLAADLGARWIVAVRRASTSPGFEASEPPDFDDAVAPVRFDNGEVTILEFIDSSDR
ncbi:hypothetical protein [Ilumatobacter sp.]|uniref:hypothetical protein n=1 Tax=Ilumatobacter sp. TaxID=1967498 RepID=UPI003AF920CD